MARSEIDPEIRKIQHEQMVAPIRPGYSTREIYSTELSLTENINSFFRRVNEDKTVTIVGVITLGEHSRGTITTGRMDNIELKDSTTEKVLFMLHKPQAQHIPPTKD